MIYHAAQIAAEQLQVFDAHWNPVAPPGEIEWADTETGEVRKKVALADGLRPGAAPAEGHGTVRYPAPLQVVRGGAQPPDETPLLGSPTPTAGDETPLRGDPTPLR